jgi:hypothetical protein
MRSTRSRGSLGASLRASAVLPEAGRPQISTSRVNDVAMHEFYLSGLGAETEALPAIR